MGREESCDEFPLIPACLRQLHPTTCALSLTGAGLNRMALGRAGLRGLQEDWGARGKERPCVVHGETKRHVCDTRMSLLRRLGRAGRRRGSS